MDSADVPAVVVGVTNDSVTFAVASAEEVEGRNEADVVSSLLLASVVVPESFAAELEV